MSAPNPSCPVHWPRAIIHLDMNAFFASVEQRDFPELRGKPIAVTNGSSGSTIITSSYEARAHGVRTGMRLQEARQICPGIIQRPTRPRVYAEVSTRIMAALEDVSPDIEVFSVDEAFLDVSHCQRLHGTPPRMARMAKQAVWKASGLLCSVGVSGDKTTAKFAAKQRKPDGLTVIPPWEARERLANEPVTALCGIGPGIGEFLARHGVLRCGQMHKLPIGMLGKRYGNLGRRIWMMCQGEDPEPLKRNDGPPQSVGHGKVLPPGTRARSVIETYLLHMSEKVAFRLRRYSLEAQRFSIGVRVEQGWLGAKLELEHPGNDGRALFALCRRVMDERWNGAEVRQVQVSALDPRPACNQDDLFAPEGGQAREAGNRAMDAINLRFGEFTLTPARLLERGDAPDVIAPAWQPTGPRRTV